ncbi:hypothetical protein PVAP13_1NG205119, partial [Panicum virgatum]
AEYYRQRQRIADAKMARSGMKFQLEKSRKAAWEHEEEVRKREYDMESAMREQSRKIDQIEAELKHAQEINDTDRVVHMDEIFSLRLAMEEMQAHMQGQVGGNPPPPPPVEQAPPLAENPPPTGMDPELDAPLAPEIDLYAHENLGGFDMEAEENLGGVELAPNVFAWANAKADGFDPEGLGPPDEDVEIVSDSEEESEPSEVEGSSGMDSLSISSFSASAAGQPHMEVVDENSVDQLPPPKVGNAAPAVPVKKR